MEISITSGKVIDILLIGAGQRSGDIKPGIGILWAFG